MGKMRPDDRFIPVFEKIIHGVLVTVNLDNRWNKKLCV